MTLSDEETAVTSALVEFIASVLDEDVFAIEPLSSAIDPNGLIAVLRSAGRYAEVGFHYDSLYVRVASNGTVTAEVVDA